MRGQRLFSRLSGCEEVLENMVQLKIENLLFKFGIFNFVKKPREAIEYANQVEKIKEKAKILDDLRTANESLATIESEYLEKAARKKDAEEKRKVKHY